MKYNKKTLITACILATALIIAFVFSLKNKKVEAPLSVPVVSTPTIAQPKYFSRPKVIVENVIMPSYTESFMKYYNGNIIQFANNCQSHPYSLVIANGSKIMLDNRSPNAEVITIGDNKYNLGPYGYQIITLNVPQIPTTFTIDCKFAQNVNTLIIQ